MAKALHSAAVADPELFSKKSSGMLVACEGTAVCQAIIGNQVLVTIEYSYYCIPPLSTSATDVPQSE